MKNQLLIFVAFVMMSFGIFGAERISVDEVANHYPWDGKVDCVCTLSGLENGYLYKGAFTLSVKKDGERVLRTVTNAIAIVDGTCTNTFDCVALFGAGFYPNGGITVDLIKYNDRTGSPIGITGDVLVIDISGGNDVSTYPTLELTGVDIGTFNCDVYKTDKIVLRKISAGSYYCHPRLYSDCGGAVAQKLATAGFYIGVFPVTQHQYELVMGKNPSYFTRSVVGNVAAQRPVEYVSWNLIRGDAMAGSAITEASDDSFLKRLNTRTGLEGFDLPTEAQWEMAARADSATEYGAYWDDMTLVALTSSNFAEAAWCESSTTHAVGGKKPNSWGIYDTLGNVDEWCRDVYISDFDVACIDQPCTETSYLSGMCNVTRGGCWDYSAASCRPSCRRYDYADSVQRSCGFRLSKSLP